jgi:hypothetical protein
MHENTSESPPAVPSFHIDTLLHPCIPALQFRQLIQGPVSTRNCLDGDDSGGRILTGKMSTNRRKGFLPFSVFRRGRPLTSKELEKDELLSFSSSSTKMHKRHWISRNGGYIFLFCVFLVFMQTGLYASQNYYHAGVPSQSDAPTSSWTSMFSSEKKQPEIQHPIPKLMDEAEIKFRRKMERQSKTLKDAVEEYKRRYKMPPPRDFDLWWQFAKDNDVVMVDEYDGLMGDLEPFYQLPGEEIRRRTVQASTIVCQNIFYANFTREGRFIAIHQHRTRARWGGSSRQP